MIVSGPCSARGERSLTIAVPVRWLGYDTALVQWSARGGSPGSIFPGRSGKLLRGDFRIAPELRGDYGLCWAFDVGNEACGV